MKGIFTELDGVSFALFHVEQMPPGGCLFRWRLLGDFPPPYLQWRQLCAEERITVVRPEVSFVAVEAEWWDSRLACWSQVALLRLADASCRFRIRAASDCAFPDGFTALAPVALGVASYAFAPLSLRAGEELEVEGISQGFSLANLLLDAGDFASRDPVLSVENLEPSRQGWQVAPESELPVLAAHPSPPPRYFAFTGERVHLPPSDS